jgi:hypothetical protein
MASTQASAVWNGTLKEGNGTMKLPKGNYEGPFTFASRFESGSTRRLFFNVPISVANQRKSSA